MAAMPSFTSMFFPSAYSQSACLQTEFSYSALSCLTTVFCSASHKFDSGCGWPAFYDNVPDTVGAHSTTPEYLH